MKVAIVGSREFVDYQLFSDCLFELNLEVSEIVSGGARGTDKMAERFTQEFGIPIRIYEADWSKGKVAGMMRNRAVVNYADVVIAFLCGKSIGTRNVIELAKRANKLYRVFDVDKIEFSGKIVV